VSDHPEGHKLIGCRCSRSLVSKIDKARGPLNRSQFVRDALLDKLRALGIDVSAAEVNAPDRKGKGGPKPKQRKYPGASGTQIWNESEKRTKSASYKH